MEESSQFNTSRHPFLTAPDPDCYFPASSIEESRRRISRAIDRSEGPCLLIGGTGTGKTILLEVLARQYQGKLNTALLAGAQLCTRRALQQSILFQMGLPYREADEGELRLSLLSHLRPRDAQPQRMLLLVDEADSLPTRLLEELRALTNIAAQGQLLVSLVLAGNPTLEERFAEPELDNFSQRLAQRCYLAAMGREETFQYLRAQVMAAGKQSTFFAQDGLEAVFSATDGVPRLINQLGAQLYWLAEETGYAPIDAGIVQQAWSELQQLPAPWNLNTPETLGSLDSSGYSSLGDGDSGGSAVEFGELSLDEDAGEEEHPALIPMVGRKSPVVDTDLEPFLEAESPADDLVTQFAGMQVAPRTPDAGRASEARRASENMVTTVPAARNPFDEQFPCEEVVFDQYREFESQVISSAPRVLNRLDTAFSRQLKMCEPVVATRDSALPTAEWVSFDGDNVEDTELDEFDVAEQEPAPFESADREAVDLVAEEPPSDEQGVWEETLPTPARFAQAEAEPGDILVLEDDEIVGPTIVSSKCYRQLFSSLERASKPQRFA